MANIPAHMRIRDEFAVVPEPRRGSSTALVSIGVAIGLAIAMIAMFAGLIH